MGNYFSQNTDESPIQTDEESSIENAELESVVLAEKCLQKLESFILPSGNEQCDFTPWSDCVTVYSQWDQLFERLRSLERCIDNDKKTESWNQWKRTYWLMMANLDADVGLTQIQTCFVISLSFLEENLLAEEKVWSKGWTDQVRSQWVDDCSSLVDPLVKFAFYDELFCNVDCLLNQFQFSSLEAYDENMREVISKIDSAAETLQKMTRDTGIADATAGSAGIVSGILTGTGVILIPFTLGASLGLTIAGASLGVGSAITALSSSIVLNVAEKKRLKEVQEETHKIAFVTVAILEMLKSYSDAALALQAKLDELEDTEALAYMTTVATKANECKNMVNLPRIIHILSRMRPNLITNELGAAVGVTSFKGINVPIWLFQIDDVAGILMSDAARIASASAKVTRVFGIIGSVLSVGFGVWDIVTGAKKIKDGSKISQKFRELKDDLDYTRRFILDAYKSEYETIDHEYQTHICAGVE